MKYCEYMHESYEDAFRNHYTAMDDPDVRKAIAVLRSKGLTPGALALVYEQLDYMSPDRNNKQEEDNDDHI